jgi:hypothetical protein
MEDANPPSSEDITNNPLYLRVKEPQRPFFEIWIDGAKMADLIEPAWDDMFWFSYKLIPVSQACDQRLRDYDIWNECKFEIREPATGQIAGVPLAGGYSFKEYCKYKTDRMTFRMLYPPLDRSNLSRWQRFRRWLLYGS